MPLHCYRILGSVQARASLAADLELRGHLPPPPPPGSAAERHLVERFVTAFGAYDVDGIVALLTEDAWVKMPPMPFEYRGREAAARFFTAIAPPGYRECRFVRTRANGQPACACYVRDPAAGVWRSIGVLVLTLAGDLISEITRFDPSVLASFGLPRTLAQPPAPDDLERPAKS